MCLCRGLLVARSTAGHPAVSVDITQVTQNTLLYDTWKITALANAWSHPSFYRCRNQSTVSWFSDDLDLVTQSQDTDPVS